MVLNKLQVFIFLLFLNVSLFSQIVTNETELNNAINNASAGTTITLANGTWKDIFINLNNKNGSLSSPITITAETPGNVLMTGNSKIYMKGSYLTIFGLIFQDPANLISNNSEIDPIFELKECNNCKIINNKIDSYNGTDTQKFDKFKWILADGLNNEIAYNSFIGKFGVGSIINDNRNSSDVDFLKIHHNYFADRTSVDGFNNKNDQDAIRIGNSSTSLQDSNTEVYDNYFYNFFGEIEIISNKSGSNKYYNNTFRKYAGSLTLRHGDNCEVYGNFFFAENNINSAGIRVIGENHKIYNNYIEGVNSKKDDGSLSGATGGINVSNGRVNTELNGYYQVLNTQIINNTFVNCDYALRIGTTVKSDLTLAPDNLTLANNIMLNTSSNAMEIETPAIGGSTTQGNITQNGNWDITNGLNNNITVTENLLVSGDEFYQLTNLSPAIDAQIGNFTFLENDILEGTRTATFDAGAEEFNAGGTRLPYTNNDIGVNLGFGATIVSNPTLTTNIATVNFTIKLNSTKTFTIISNVDWEIINSIPWVTISQSSGSGTKEITITTTENNSGVERTGLLTINETNNTNALTTSINVIQSNESLSSENATEIVAETVTAVGTQLNDDGTITNGPENTNDNDTDTRWSASSRDGSAFLTYDLGCSHKLTDVSIYFHKSTVRTTTISIATSNDGVNYTDAYTQISSTQLTQEAFEDFDMNLIEAQYIRIFGFGNSDNNNTSPWNSIEEVKFFGDFNCVNQNTLNIQENSLRSKGISIYPIPVTNELLTISSENIAINSIVIYNATGQKVLFKNGQGSFLSEINTSTLATGIYYIVLDGIGVSKFIIK